jgi:hypothetical protein
MYHRFIFRKQSQRRMGHNVREYRMTAVVSPQLLKALTDLTGEIHLDSALRMVTQDAIVYRLESIAKQLLALEQKYGISFEQFDERFQAEELPNPYSYEVEQDYLEWEGLLCRKRRLQEVRDWLH